MRLFVAIPLPAELRESLGLLQDVSAGGLNWQDPGQMHLTLRFIGEVDEPVAGEIAGALRTVEFPPFELTFRGTGAFPDEGHPSVIWAGVRPEEPLMRLQEEVEEVCRDVGLDPERRGYVPHVTIGRVKGDPEGPAGEAARAWLRRHRDWEAQKCPVRAFVLFESTLTRNGAVHSARARFKAGDAQE